VFVVIYAARFDINDYHKGNYTLSIVFARRVDDEPSFSSFGGRKPPQAKRGHPNQDNQQEQKGGLEAILAPYIAF
jgi:hypothetical protein